MSDDTPVLTLDTLSIDPDGCYGIYRIGNEEICKTLERTFDDIKPIIPGGRFKCVKTKFIRGGYPTFEITGVEGHSRLLHHRGNVEGDSVGCILLGLGYGMFGVTGENKLPKNGEEVIRSIKGVTQSGAAFARWWRIVKDFDWYWLDVINRSQ